MEDERETSSLKNKLKSSICLSCCFRNGHHETLESEEKPRLIRSSSTWLRSRAHELPEVKEKCRNLISRIGKGRKHSADFRYDALSYALNFDEGFGDSQVDEFPLRNFSARLPATPPPPNFSTAKGVAPPMVVSREIAAFS
ncbi:hypothetical protein HHK36_013868 [Tetracentron sinense]|uniref:Uncharacterized protein n=1 Tax=Tetracentron sinense TaxID=13715 RepID=A0A834Z2W3_TETSI|nr:hypothetical protein HHK36_013868 [Tetracentron sinense]